MSKRARDLMLRARNRILAAEDWTAADDASAPARESGKWRTAKMRTPVPDESLEAHLRMMRRELDTASRLVLEALNILKSEGCSRATNP